MTNNCGNYFKTLFCWIFIQWYQLFRSNNISLFLNYDTIVVWTNTSFCLFKFNEIYYALCINNTYFLALDKLVASTDSHLITIFLDLLVIDLSLELQSRKFYQWVWLLLIKQLMVKACDFQRQIKCIYSPKKNRR